MLKPIRRLGQNFLRDPNTIQKIIDSLESGPDDVVMEIGPGTGALTGGLSAKYPRFSAIELDTRAAELIASKWPGINLIQGDVLDLDWSAFAASQRAERISVIGNLPYYITSQILFSLLDASSVIREAVLMMQYEVAARLTAAPRTKQYGILSVATQHVCRPQLLFPVSRNVFYPKPDVRSAIVRLDFSPKSTTRSTTIEAASSGGPEANSNEARVPHSSVDEKWLRKVVRMAFNQRRKTLRNSLSAILAETGKSLPVNTAGKRAEELSPDDFVELALYLHDATREETQA